MKKRWRMYNEIRMRKQMELLLPEPCNAGPAGCMGRPEIYICNDGEITWLCRGHKRFAERQPDIGPKEFAPRTSGGKNLIM